MFSLLLAVLIINNKLNNVPVAKEFWNFAVFCILIDLMFLLINLYTLKKVYSKKIAVFVLVNIFGIIQSGLFLSSGNPHQSGTVAISESSYIFAIIYITFVVLLSVYVNYQKMDNTSKRVGDF